VKETPTPIAIFCFKRFDLLKKLLNSLKKNKECKKSIVFFFLDNAKNKLEKESVRKVHQLISDCDFFKEKKIILRKKNYGLRKNILCGINYIFSRFNKIIVLEDDLEVSKNFLKTINILLNKYQSHKSINTVCGYSFVKGKGGEINQDFFLMKRPSSWGWATWRHKWDKINNSKICKYSKPEEYGNDLSIMAIKKKREILDSWAYDWTMKHIYQEKFCIYPKFSMIKNNGFDTHATNNLFGNKKFFSRIYNKKFKNYFYQEENKKIKYLSKLNYDMNVLIFIIKFLYFNFLYEKSKKILRICNFCFRSYKFIL
jgi:hypothetical protein